MSGIGACHNTGMAKTNNSGEHANSRPVVTIVGGGFSGTMVAVNLLRHKDANLDIVLVEPREKVGLGLAYSTPCSEHLLNVRASGMSALVEEPTHFHEYALHRDEKFGADTFVPRMIFGQYVRDLLQTTLSEPASKGTSFKHVSGSVVDIQPPENNSTAEVNTYNIILSDGQSLRAAIVVLAMGNLSAVRPGWSKGIADSEHFYMHDPWDEKFGPVKPDADILMIGTGLTAVDKIIQLQEAAHIGKIYAISRHGLFPRPHTVEPSPLAFAENCDAKSVLKTFVKMKTLSTKAEDWRDIVDSVRPYTQKWWCNLETLEQKRFLRHLQTLWDVHRHRMAPQISARIEAMRQSGQLELLAGRLQKFEKVNERVQVNLKPRHTGESRTLIVDRAINCMGPQAKLETVDSDLLRKLKERGLIVNHKVGSGIACEPSGEVVDSKGNVQAKLLAIGPMLKAELLESVAVPELKVQAKLTADRICQLLHRSCLCCGQS